MNLKHSAQITHHSMIVRFIGFLIVVLFLGFASDVLAQNSSAVKMQTPKPAASTGKDEKIPVDQDPNAPGISRKERIARQEALLKQKVAEGEAARKAESTKLVQDKISNPNRPNPAARTEGAAPVSVINPNGVPEGGGAPAAATLPGGRGRGVSPRQQVQAGTKLLESKKDADYRFMSIYLVPASVVTKPGELFDTEVRFMNIDRLQTDRIDIVMQFPTAEIEFAGVLDDSLRPHLAGDPEFEIDTDSGILHYRAQLNKVVSPIDMKLLDVVWKAKRPVENTSINLFTHADASALFLGHEVVTENVFGRKGTLSGTGVRIESANGSKKLDVPTVENPSNPPTFRLDYPRAEFYEPGQWVVFDIAVENPGGVNVDEIALTLRYDPEVIEFTDTDRGNWITAGNNILDGPFHDSWPWTMLLTNRIDPSTDIIEYHMATSQNLGHASGIVARAFGRVKRMASDPLLTVVYSDSAQKGQPGTGIFSKGHEMSGRAQSKTTNAPRSAEKADPAVYRF